MNQPVVPTGASAGWDTGDVSQVTMMQMSAEFSPCKRFRYALWRVWDHTKPFVLFICLNPSIADEKQDSRTSRRCIRFAQSWGFGRLCMANLFAYRSQDPRGLWQVSDPVGFGNDRRLGELATQAGMVVAAWGHRGSYRNRDKEVVAFIPNLYCLGKTKEGNPRHPLFVTKETKPVKYND
ncbi:MAG: DUF1643 domain-containing protein [Acidobacteriota bacterium]